MYIQSSILHVQYKDDDKIVVFSAFIVTLTIIPVKTAI